MILIRPLLYSEAFRVFLGRKRKMKPESFLKTQAGVLEVFYNHITVEDYPDVEKQVYISYVGVEGGEYTQISLDAEDSTVEQKILMLKDVKEMYEQDSLTEQELFEIMSEIESS